jgi:hypothetical protein
MTPELTDKKREQLLRILEALLEKTTKRGATEAEAKAAAAKAQELMDKYGLELSDIKAADPHVACGHGDIHYAGRKFTHEAQYTCNAIAELTGTKAWSMNTGDGVRIRFFGLHNDVSVACWLYRTFQSAMEFEWVSHWNHHGDGYRAHVRTVRKSFMMGMANRLNERVRQLKAEHDAQEVNNSRAIVLAKKDLVERALAVENIRFRTNKRRHSRISYEAYAAGQQAANRVSFNPSLK